MNSIITYDNSHPGKNWDILDKKDVDDIIKHIVPSGPILKIFSSSSPDHFFQKAILTSGEYITKTHLSNLIKSHDCLECKLYYNLSIKQIHLLEIPNKTVYYEQDLKSHINTCKDCNENYNDDSFHEKFPCGKTVREIFPENKGIKSTFTFETDDRKTNSELMIKIIELVVCFYNEKLIISNDIVEFISLNNFLNSSYWDNIKHLYEIMKGIDHPLANLLKPNNPKNEETLDELEIETHLMFVMLVYLQSFNSLLLNFGDYLDRGRHLVEKHFERQHRNCDICKNYYFIIGDLYHEAESILNDGEVLIIWNQLKYLENKLFHKTPWIDKTLDYYKYLREDN